QTAQARLKAFQHGETERNDRENYKGDPQECSPAFMVKRRHKYHQRDPHQDPGHQVEERRYLQDKLVQRKQGWSNQRFLRLVAPGHAHGMAGLTEQRHHLVFTQRAAEPGLLVLNLRAQIVAQLSDDVLLLRLGQPKPYRVQIAIQKIHTNALLKNAVRFMGNDPAMMPRMEQAAETGSCLLENLFQ